MKRIEHKRFVVKDGLSHFSLGTICTVLTFIPHVVSGQGSLTSRFVITHTPVLSQ
jgi:hypothetical protein